MKERRRELCKNMTYSEKLVWLYLRKRQMKERFLRQYSIDKFVIDFYCPKLKLAVEIDGNIHKQEAQIKYDKDRQNYLEHFGITFIRIENEELFCNPDKAFGKIEEVIKTLTRPSPL